MATYDFQEYASYIYDAHTGTYTFQTSDSSRPSTLDDGDPLSHTFVVGEEVSKVPTFFAGSIEIDGESYPVDRQGTDAFVNVPIAGSVDFPKTFTDAHLDTGAFTPCFAGDTLIATPSGEVRVDCLQIGDTVTTLGGGVETVRWVGTRTLVHWLHDREGKALVCVCKDALGDGVPHTDLIVTADHGLLIGDVMCNAGALANGSTIISVPLADQADGRFTVYHVETETHAVILANGAATETFIDNISRRAFSNFAEFHALYGDVDEMEPLPYPRAMSVRQVPAKLRARLNGETAA